MSRTIVLRCHQRPRSLSITVSSHLEVDGHLMPGTQVTKTIVKSTIGTFDWLSVLLANSAVVEAMTAASQVALPFGGE